MKVLQVINSLLSGGAEKLLVDSIIKYENKGLQVDLLLLYGEKTPFYEYLQSRSNVNIISLGDKSFVYNPMFALRLNKYLKRYDIVHVHLFPSLYWVALANLISLKKHKIVLTEHSSSNKRRNHSFFRTVDRIIYKQFNKIITISNSVNDNLQNHLGSKFTMVHKIYNGIDLEAIRTAKEYDKSELGLDKDTKLVIQVSSFRYPKDQETVIKAISKLPENVNLLLVGDGELRKKCEELSEKLRIQQRVYFLGIRSDVPRLLKTSDIVVLSSHYEGLSLSSVEGMASGKPFIATSSPGLKEVVENAGRLFPIGDVSALVKEISSLLDDSVHYNEIVYSCQKKAKLFDIEIMTDKYIEVYKEIIKNPKQQI
ncbi:glycosyltransferase involved in cell wall biosynthesis [Aquimarina sp. MAR_2010_214]|uniref:glycosyltransferase n=1 Tax=Aquimarina sp. MAR_2010_214 TaxID=1250026 RepID=UPI000C702242|nr:glycosyltransferase [Aquimarina sp. MAR_2010_214]PKV50984.1 glycosyltransferase involved in cell wall biosynthesis [Aquimarina sp. MAR_2010_214]